MNESKAILLIIFGAGLVIAGFTVRQFYAAKGLYGAGGRGNPIARWKGQLLFISIGIVFLAFGISYFFVPQ